MTLKIINNYIITKTINYKGKEYGQDKNGNVYHTQATPVKNKNGEYELFLKWYKVHYLSYEKLAVLDAFNNNKK